MAISKAELKNLASLKTKKGRNAENRFFAEGIRALEEAIKFNFLPVKLIYSQADLTERGERLVARFNSKKIATMAVSRKEMNAISETESAQGIVGIFDVPESKLSKLYKPSYRKVLLCDRINDPGNLGTLVRTALAFEFDMMIVTDNSVELFNPKVVRASAGAMFGLPTSKASYQELKKLKVSTNAKLVAATVQPDGRNETREIFRKNIAERSPLILAIGSEAEGLSEEVLSMADCTITIGHSSNVDSLNAAVAGAILMQEIYEIQRTKDRE